MVHYAFSKFWFTAVLPLEIFNCLCVKGNNWFRSFVHFHVLPEFKIKGLVDDKIQVLSIAQVSREPFLGIITIHNDGNPCVGILSEVICSMSNIFKRRPEHTAYRHIESIGGAVHAKCRHLNVENLP